MKDNFSKDLFEKYNAGKCTKEEMALLEGWYLNELKNSDFVPEKNIEAVQRETWTQIKPASKILTISKWIGYAAALLIAVTFIYRFKKFERTEKSISAVNFVRAKASADSVIIASNTEKRMIKLPDSTVVILERGSKLTILSTFNDKYSREVKLVGKAYFDVAHIPAKPFIVYVGNIRTTVLGTAFDITSSTKSKFVKINVIRGLVEIRNMKADWHTYLKKNMQVISGDTAMISRKIIDAEKELSWNNKEDIKFDDISFRDSKKLLEDRFHIKINLNDAALQKEKFSTLLRANERLDHFLSIICSFNNATYHFNRDSTEVSIKPLNHN